MAPRPTAVDRRVPSRDTPAITPGFNVHTLSLTRPGSGPNAGVAKRPNGTGVDATSGPAPRPASGRSPAVAADPTAARCPPTSERSVHDPLSRTARPHQRRRGSHRAHCPDPTPRWRSPCLRRGDTWPPVLGLADTTNAQVVDLGVGQWRCRESNPGPPSLHEGFSVRSPRCLYSDPPVTRTSRCDDPSRCLLSPPAPRPGGQVSPLADAGVRGGEHPRSDRFHTRSGGEGEISATVVGTCFFATGG
jgi:hypothetical protein